MSFSNLPPSSIAMGKFDGAEGAEANWGPTWVVTKTVLWALLAAVFWIADGIRRWSKGERLEDHCAERSKISEQPASATSEFGVSSHRTNTLAPPCSRAGAAHEPPSRIATN